MQDACGSLEIFLTLMAATVSNGCVEETYYDFLAFRKNFVINFNAQGLVIYDPAVGGWSNLN